ncbi:unnamed protein product [Thelazia callipaeda]|uniref:Nematode cuticle collagen N-terminal domain-containing protein n=1 Tax=Thelazia callipaeda TaxID=103827 RepID=A0A0N5CSJ9_THECL|nr:unnamed protein product [Thelazia callipaeda]
MVLYSDRQLCFYQIRRWQLESVHRVARRNTGQQQRYDDLMAERIAKHSKAVVLTICLAAVVTIALITGAVATGAVIRCSLCYDQFIPENAIL